MIIPFQKIVSTKEFLILHLDWLFFIIYQIQKNWLAVLYYFPNTKKRCGTRIWFIFFTSFFVKKFFPCNILSIRQVPISDFNYFLRYQIKCAFKFLLRHIMTTWILKFVFDHLLLQWLTEKGGKLKLSRTKRDFRMK